MGQALLSHEDVVDRVKRFQELLVREKELQKFLVDLKIHGSQEQVREQVKLHDDAIAEIHKIRLEGIVPIVQELAEFTRLAKEEEKRKGTS